jgi:hypothetical protein
MALVSTHTIPRILDLLSVGKFKTAAMMVTHGMSSSQLEAVIPTAIPGFLRNS